MFLISSFTSQWHGHVLADSLGSLTEHGVIKHTFFWQVEGFFFSLLLMSEVESQIKGSFFSVLEF